MTLLFVGALAAALLVGVRWDALRRANAGLTLAVACAAAAAAGLGLRSVAWVGGYHARRGDPIGRLWELRFSGHKLEWSFSETRALLGAGAAVAVLLLGAALREREVDDAQPGERSLRKLKWYKPERLTDALIQVSILRPGKDGLRPRITQRGRVRSDEFGDRVKYALPAGMTFDLVELRRTALASVLGVPSAQLLVSQDESDPANVVTFAVVKPAPPVGSGKNAVVRERSWGRPVRIGHTPQGESVELRVDGTHSLFVGATESGKTVCARTLVAHALLDPDIKVFGISGKGEAADWDDMGPACEMYIPRVDDSMPTQLLAMLQAVLAHGRAVSASSKVKGRARPNALLVVEEWAAVRTHCGTVLGKRGLEAIDKDMATILATLRSAGVHVMLITQRPTDDSFPVLQRANVVQRICLRTTQSGDTTIAIGDRLEVPRPTKRGQAIVVDSEHGQRYALVDNLTDEEWERICQRAIELRRRGVTAEFTPPVPAPPPSVPPVHMVKVDEAKLRAAVIEVFERSNTVELTPQQLWDMLPEGLRTDSATTLGRSMSMIGWRSVRRNNRRLYLYDQDGMVDP